MCGSLGALVVVSGAASAAAGIRSKLLCTFYVHLATCKMGRKTRRNDSYIHSGKKGEPFTAHDQQYSPHK